MSNVLATDMLRKEPEILRHTISGNERILVETAPETKNMISVFNYEIQTGYSWQANVDVSIPCRESSEQILTFCGWRQLGTGNWKTPRHVEMHDFRIIHKTQCFCHYSGSGISTNTLCFLQCPSRSDIKR